MADNKVKFLRGTSAEYEAKTKDNDTFYYTTDTKKLYLGETEITGIEIDDASTTATDKTWSAKKINDSIPTELPADGGNADTLAGNSIDKFLKYNGVATDCNKCTTRGVYQATSSTLNVPSVLYSSDRTPILITFDGSFQLFFTGDELYSRAYCIDPSEITSPHWSDWRIVSNDDNADTVDGLHANEIASNSNLLDNPDFRINQRGQTDYSISGSAYAFTLDRWIISRAVVSVIDGGISAAWNGTDSTNGWIQQHIENAADFAGMTITVSALVDGEVLSGTATVPTTVNSSNSITTSNPSINFTVGHYSNNRLGVAIILLSATPCVIGWVKAEIGANATPFVPPNVADELAKCQRYFNSLFMDGIPVEFIGSGIAVNNNMATILVNLPTVMRSSAPTVSLTGTLYLSDGSHNAENSIAMQGIAGSHLNRNVLQLNLTSGSTLDRTATYLLSRSDKDTTLTVSAEL